MASLMYAGNPVRKRGKLKSASRIKSKRTAQKPRARRGRNKGGAVKINVMAVRALSGGIVGALGAVVASAIMSKLPLKGGLLDKPEVRGLVGIAMGVGAGFAVAKFAKKPEIGKGIATGAAAVGIYQLAKPHVEKMTGLNLSGGQQSLLSSELLGWYSAGPNYRRPAGMIQGAR